MNRIEVSELEFIKIEPRGRAISEKFWVMKDNIKKLVKASENGIDQDLMEKLSSDILKRLDIACVDVELGFDALSNKNCCLVSSFLNDEDVSYEFTDWKPIRNVDEFTELDMCFEQVFDKFNNLYHISEEEIMALKSDYIRTIFGKCIIENFDTKLENIGLIFNEMTEKYRLPASFDNGFAFKGYNSVVSPVVCIGEQFYDLYMVVDYIIDFYPQCVDDIFPKLDDFVNNELFLLLDKYDIIPEKKQYIIKYLNDLNIHIERKKAKCK